MVGKFLIKQFESPYNKILVAEENVDGVVVLGGGHILGTLNLPMQESAFKRLMYGIMLAKKYNLPLIFSGTNKEHLAVKKVVEELNHTLDINLTHSTKLQKYFSINYEKQSLDTMQNAQCSKTFFENHGINHPKIYLVTSAVHMKRSQKLFKHFGFTVIPAATDFKAGELHRFDYLPSITGLQLSYDAFHEFIGNLRYAFKN